MNFWLQYRNLPISIYILSVSRAMVNMGSMIVFPFISLLLTNYLNYSEAETGLIIFIASICSIIGSILGGVLSDKINRKIILCASSTAIIIFSFITSFLLPNRLSIITINIMFLAFNTILPTIAAMVLDYSETANKSECFSLMYLAGNIGNAIGPLLTGLLFYSHMSWIFLCTCILFFINVLLVLFGLKNKDVIYREKEIKYPGLIPFLTPSFITFCLCIAILNTCYIALDFVLPLQLSDCFGLRYGSKLSSLVWTINGVLVIFATPIIVSFSKKKNYVFCVAIGGLFYAFGFFFYATTNSVPLFMGTILIWTTGEILISTSAGLYIADQLPENFKGRSMSLYESSCSIGKLIGPVLFGFMMISHSYFYIWLIISLLCIISSVITGLLFVKHKT